MKKTIRLKNGIQVIYDCIPQSRQVAFHLFFRAGTFYESGVSPGISHLCEHMFFRKLNGLQQDELYFKMESIGATLRGRTFRDFICFDICCLSEYFFQAFDIISAILYDFTWNQDDLNLEKNVVYKQIESHSKNYDNYMEELYFGYPEYAVPIMGERKDIEAIEVNEVNQFKKKFLNCNNACVVITGAFHSFHLNQAMKILQNVENKGEAVKIRRIYPKHSFYRKAKDDRILPSDTEQSDVKLYFDIDLKKINIVQIAFVSSILGAGVGSRLSRKMTDLLALTDSIFSCINYYNKTFASLSIEYSVNNRDLIYSLQVLLEELQNLKKEITQKDYLASIVYFTKGMEAYRDDIYQLGFDYGWQEFIMEMCWDIEKQSEENTKITITDLINTANQVLTSENLKTIIFNNRNIEKKTTLQLFLDRFRENL